MIAADGLTIIDSLVTPAQAAPFAAALAELTDLPVRRVVVTGSHIAQVGGRADFALAAIYGSGQTSHHLDQPANPDVWVRLHPEHANAFDAIVDRPVTHIIAEAAHLCPASIAIPVTGQQFENVVVQVPSANVVFAGAVASFGVTPDGFEADFATWIDTLEQIKSWGQLVIPGVGPVGGHEEVTALQEYLHACIDADGSISALADGPWETWQHPEFHEVNVERAARLASGDPSPPESYRRLLGLR